MQNSIKKLLERFTKGINMDSTYATFQVRYAGGENERSVHTVNPSITGDSYFIAEVSISIGPRQGYAIYSHAFQLDMASLRIEMKAIFEEENKSQDLLENICAKTNIARILTNVYDQVADHLKDYNHSKDDSQKIAAILYKYRGGVLNKFNM